MNNDFVTQNYLVTPRPRPLPGFRAPGFGLKPPAKRSPSPGGPASFPRPFPGGPEVGFSAAGFGTELGQSTHPAGVDILPAKKLAKYIFGFKKFVKNKNS